MVSQWHSGARWGEAPSSFSARRSGPLCGRAMSTRSAGFWTSSGANGSSRASVAGAGSRVGLGPAAGRDELPRVRAVRERELQDAELAAQVHLAVCRKERVGLVQSLAPRSDDELANPVCGI